MDIKVVRHRSSVTQGYATVYINDTKIVTFGDDIEIIKEGQQYYGDMIGGWASTTPDADFIKGVFNIPCNSEYRDKAIEVIIEEAIKEATI